MTTTRAQPFEMAQRPREPSVPAADLGDILNGLADEVMDGTAFERVVVVAGFLGDLLGVGRGVPELEVDAFTRAFARWQVAGLGDAVPEAEESPLVALASMQSPVLLPALSPDGDFSAVVVVEAAAEHSSLTRVSDALRAATPAAVTAAAIYTLRSQLAAARSALDALPDPVLVTDAESRLLPGNRRAEDLFVRDPADASGRRHAVETNNVVLSAFQPKARAAARPHTSREIVLLDPEDGSDVSFEVVAIPVDDSDSSTQGQVLVLRDVTDLKAAARELEVQFSRSVAAQHRAHLEWERLDVIVQNAAVPIIVTDGNRKIQRVNGEAARLLEPRPGTTLSSPRIRDIEANHTKLAGFVGDLLLHARARHEGRLVLVDPDEAREFSVLAVSTKVLGDRGEPTAVVTVLHDLRHEVENRHLTRATGELTRRNTQLEAQHSALERAARLKDEFLATMSHELRTPINAVLGYNSLLRDGLFGKLTEKQDEALDRMRNAAEHLLSLINDVLDLSRIGAGKIALSPEEIEWPSFLETLSEAARPLAARKSLAYTVAIEPGLPGIRTDEMRLRQVLLNLLINAVKFTDRGWLELRVSSAPGGHRVRIDVTDTGIGIDEANLDAIFDEFTQVDQSSTREHGGAGLGLAIGRRLIRAMGGSLTVKSTPGKGSTFRVELPTAPPVSRDAIGSAAPRSATFG